MSERLLIIDDDAGLAEMLGLHFEDQGYEVLRAASTAEGLESARTMGPDLILLDQRLPDGTGLALLGELLALQADVPVIMMTGAHDLELAIQAIKQGARDFVHKPVKTRELNQAVARALEHRRLARAASMEAPRTDEGVALGDLIGRSDAMLAISKEIALTADSEASVLLVGESGTGKEVVARAIHHHSGRPGPFVAVNSAAIVDTLLESELFGHEKGAFTGAVSRKPGKFEIAQDGTLFLDEIGELALPLQAKLLRVLQEHSYERVGGTEVLSTNARIVAATNRDLEAEAAAKRFREDLLYRLNVIQIRLPPLRERNEDVPLLTRALLERIAKSLHKPPLKVSDEAMGRLLSYAWPGNVRELENTLTQCMVRARDGLLTGELLPLPSPASPGDGPGAEGGGTQAPLLSLQELEARHIQRVLTHTLGHKGRTCEILGISRPALDRKIEKYHLQVPRRA